MGSPQISEIVARILAADPDSVVCLRLQKDVLHIPVSKLISVKKRLDSNPWVKQLAKEQHPDGGWGRFHTRDSQSTQKIITTEFGVDRGLALGLDASHPIFGRVVDYLAQLLRGTIDFPDRPERNDRWLTGVQLFVAATLAQLKPNHPFVDQTWDLWAEIAARTFNAGEYNPEAEIQAHRELTGATIKGSYLVLNNKYTLTLLSARSDDLPKNLADQLLRWAWQHRDGLRYLGVPAADLPENAHPSIIDRWFSTQALLARFSSWPAQADEVVAWLWDQQGADDLWDFGPRSPGSYTFPYSLDWRKAQNRKFDWSTRTLNLLAKYEVNRN
jgi:hypothetical protein